MTSPRQLFEENLMPEILQRKIQFSDLAKTMNVKQPTNLVPRLPNLFNVVLAMLKRSGSLGMSSLQAHYKHKSRKR